METDARVEIKETIIPVIFNKEYECDEQPEITILQRTVYINGSYFMTYATYINDIYSACMLGIVPQNTPNICQIPLQLATMLLFGAVAPLPNLDCIIPTTEQERMIIKLYKDILKN